ncbi:LysR family substrate-binding domain-containing protein [Saxibacter everestensis]|uniref:LysR family substrate-binding domain-containing protein n=1 Tax=Saxibacter everestensis TaxID=2909229 RepID=A0ABY8QX46_9MICO|nr:LysR family substrate-binding domain-containing protein [Brevibacteriaceae bacterium ZFBP1038]
MNEQGDSPSATTPLTVAFVPGVTPTKWLRRWNERRPDSPINTIATVQDQQTVVLHEGRAQLSFVRLPVQRDGLSVVPLYREQPFVVAPKGHLITAAENVAVEELADEHLLQQPDEVPEWRDIASEIRLGTRIPVPQLPSAKEAIELVAAGAGIVIVPQSIARLYNRKDVVTRPVSGVPETEIALAWITDSENADMEEFYGIVRGRTERSSRTQRPAPADAVAAEARKPPPKKPQQRKRSGAGQQASSVPQRYRPRPGGSAGKPAKKGKRRGGR